MSEGSTNEREPKKVTTGTQSFRFFVLLLRFGFGLQDFRVCICCQVAGFKSSLKEAGTLTLEAPDEDHES